MPQMKLTQLACERLKPPTDKDSVIFWDLQLPGFGLRVSSRGRKTWITMYRVNRREVMETIGTMALIPNVAQARDAARASMLKARQGINPVEQRRERERALASAAEVQRFTFAKLCARFLREYAERKTRPSSVYQYRRTLARALAVWSERPANDISKRDVRELIDEIANKRLRKQTGAVGGAGIESNNVLTSLKTMFRWAVREDILTADPTEGVAKLGKEVPRDRVLDADEIKLFWEGAEELGWPFEPLFKLLLITAQRRDEGVGKMGWNEIDLDKSRWTIPATRSKNGKAHIVHLTPLAMSIIESLPRLSGSLVFSTTGSTSVSGHSTAKSRVDEYMRSQMNGTELPGWTLHDLRRTATTIMAEELKIAPHVVDKILNHTAGTISGVARVYNRAEYLDERKAALEAWSRWLEALLGLGEQGNVVTLAVRG
jgi:integrase